MPKRCVLPLLVVACGSSCLAQGAANNHLLRYSESHGMTFSEIGDPGAPGITGIEPGFGLDVINGVDYRYRIATTEVTKAQYFRFAQAAAPHIQSLGGDPDDLAGWGTLSYLGISDGIPRYQLEAGTDHQPAKNNLRYFALMANWLHNGAPGKGEAVASDFTSGAYDDWTSPTRSEGAEFWIPSRDEWAKAAYYDPNRYGQGQGGYWQYPISSDTAPVPGDPALGGQTSAGNGSEWPEGQFRPADVGSYADVLSPWGLLDASGSEREWTGTRGGDFTFVVESSSRGVTDSTGMIVTSPGDALGFDRRHTPRRFVNGIQPSSITVRFAAAIPAPGVPMTLALGALLAARRRR